MVLSQFSGTMQNLKNKKSNEIDTTGRRYIFTVKGAAYPQARRLNTKNSTNCKFCNKDNQCIDILESRLNNIDNIIDSLTGIIPRSQNSSDLNKNYFSSNLNGIDLSTIDIQNLLMISNNIGFGLYDIRNHNTPKV